MAEEDAAIAEEFFKREVPDREAALTLIGEAAYRARALFDPEPLYFQKENENGAFEPCKIALIPFAVSVHTRSGRYVPPDSAYPPEGAAILAERQFDHFDLCVNPEGPIQSVQDWCEKFLKPCRFALQQGARFVVFPELSFPNFWPGREAAELHSGDRRRQLYSIKAKLDVELQGLATTHNAVIVSGSYHDWETFENISPIYFPNREQSRNHKKITTAYVVHERIKTAGTRQYPVYHVNGRRFCVLICSDAFDLNMFFAQVLAHSSGATKISPQIYFVPSFYIGNSDSHAMKDACKQLSMATGQSVLFVSQAGNDEIETGQGSLAAFVAGIEVQVAREESCYFLDLNAELLAQNASQTGPIRRSLNSFMKSTRRVYG